MWAHTASIGVVAIAVNISAYFIMVANSFMQHPVGAVFNPETQRAELVDLRALLTNSTALAAFPHAVAGSFLTAGTFMLGVSAWWIVHSRRGGQSHTVYERTFRKTAKVGWWTTVISVVAVTITGDIQAKLMFVQQPMKMASAESLCHTQTDPMFSILTVGTHNDCASVSHWLELPWVLPFLAEGKISGVTLQGVHELQQQAQEMFGPGNYAPNLFVTYWSFRAMIGLMLGSLALAFFAWLFLRGGRVPTGKWSKIFAIGSLVAIPFPFLANSAGWIFTEMGRQPWIVHPNPEHAGDPRTELIRMTVDMGVSDHAPITVWITLIGFTVIYLVLAVVWFWLIRRAVIAGPPTNDLDVQAPGPAAPVATDLQAKVTSPVRFAQPQPATAER